MMNVTNITGPTVSGIDDSVRTYFCNKGDYNDMATLFFNSQEEAIKQLFHQEGRSLSLFSYIVCKIGDSIYLNPGPAEPDTVCLCTQCRSRSVGLRLKKPTDLDLHCL